MHVKGVAILLQGCMKEFSVRTQLIIDGWDVKGACWKRLASNPGLNHISTAECDYFQENKNSMAEFPGTAVGFLLLKME